MSRCWPAGLREVPLECGRCKQRQTWMLPWGDERIPACYRCGFHLRAI